MNDTGVEISTSDETNLVEHQSNPELFESQIEVWSINETEHHEHENRQNNHQTP
jgi:hypothetical protein